MKGIMTGITVAARSGKEAPDYKKTAAALLARCREFYQEPQNELAFQEWMAERKGKKTCRGQSLPMTS